MTNKFGIKVKFYGGKMKSNFCQFSLIAGTSFAIFPKDHFPSLDKRCKSNLNRCVETYNHFKYIYEINKIGNITYFLENSSFV